MLQPWRVREGGGKGREEGGKGREEGREGREEGRRNLPDKPRGAENFLIFLSPRSD
jgi:hypothetical protein